MPDKKSSEELLKDLRHNYEKDAEADRTNRAKAVEDMRFVNVPGEQWDKLIRTERGDRPMYEFNKLRVTIKRVVNDMRANRPSGKVRASEDGDVEKAEIYEGLIRNIWNVSDADTVIDSAAEYQVTSGMGAWRVTTKIPDDEVVNQDIVIEGIKNPFCLYADRHCQDPLKRDARHWIVTSMVGHDEFEATYGKKVEKTNFESVGFDNVEHWLTDDSVRVCEYWYQEPVTKTLLLLDTGETIDKAGITPEEWTVVAPHVTKQRDVKTHDIYSCIASGTEILSGPDKWAGDQFPFILIYGEYVIIDGVTHWYGLTRWSKDAQRAYNYTRSTIIETIALAPQAKWWATPAQALGLQTSWSEAHKKNLPVMFYNPDQKAPGPPQRMGGADVPAALMEESQLASEDIKATSGIFDNSLGKTANETSGVAIRARQQQGEIATFNYMDNLTKGVQRTWEILVDLIPKIYDGERTVRILGKDGAEKFHKLNQSVIDPQTGQPIILNDLSEGKYDVTVTSGPSFATQRQEAAQTYGEMMQGNPALFPLIGDLVMKATDLPYADEIATRLKAMLPPQLQEQPDGKPLPPEAIQAMQQASQAMQHVQQMTQMLQDAQAEVTKESQAAQQQTNDLAIKKAELDATYEKYMGNIVKAQSALAVQEAQAGAKTDAADQAQHHIDLANQMNDGLAEIKLMAANFLAQAAASMGQMQQAQVVVAPAPPAPAKRRTVRVKRINGELHGDITEVPDQVTQ